MKWLQSISNCQSQFVSSRHLNQSRGSVFLRYSRFQTSLISSFLRSQANIFYSFILTTMEVALDQPVHWSSLTIAQQKVQEIHSFLLNTHQLISQAKRIAGYCQGSEPITETAMRWLVCSIPEVKWEKKQQELRQQAQPFITQYEKVAIQQRKITLSFLRAATRELARNSQLLLNDLEQVRGEITEQYASYIKIELINSLKALRTFLAHQNTLIEEYRLFTSYYQDQPDLREQYRLAVEEEDLSEHLRLDKVEQVSRQLEALSNQAEDQMRRVNIVEKQSAPCCFQLQVYVLLVLLTLSLVGLTYFLNVFWDNLPFLKDNYRNWVGAGSYLFYQWINCLLVNYCRSRRIDLLLGMGCLSPLELAFYGPAWLVVLLLLTLLYVWLLTVFVRWPLDCSWLSYIINGVLIGFWCLELVLRCRMRRLVVVYSKLSMVHCLTVLIPVTDIVRSLLMPSKSVELAIQIGIHLVTVVCAGIIEVVRREELRGQHLDIFMGVLALNVGLELVIMFMHDQLNSYRFFVGTSVILNIVLLCFFLAYRYEPFSVTALKREFKELLCSICAKDPAERERARLKGMTSHPLTFKLISTFFSLCFLIILPCSIYWTQIDDFDTIGRYTYQTVVMALYILWSIFYINEIDVNSRHPLANFMRLTFSLWFAEGIGHEEDIELGEEVDKYSRAMAKRREAEVELQKLKIDPQRLQVEKIRKQVEVSLAYNLINN